MVSEFDEVGAIAHELAHDFGGPDLYDYHSSRPWTTGMSMWDLMSGGSYNGNPPGSSPSEMCAYNKHRLGWVDDRDIMNIQDGSRRVQLVPMSVQTSGYRAIRYDLPDGTYYLVEARSLIGFDSALPSGGVLVMLVNESRFDELRDAVQLQVPGVASWLGDAALRSGETFNDTHHSFAVKVVHWTDQLVTVDVGTTLVEDWSVSEKIRLNEGVSAEGAFVTTAQADWYLGGSSNYVFAAVFVSNVSAHYVNIYRSENLGRDWLFLASTNRTSYRLDRYAFSFCYFEGFLFLVGRVSDAGNMFFGILEYSIAGNSFSIVNLTEMSKAYIWSSAVSAGTDALYISADSIQNGTAGIVYFKLANTLWNHTFCPIPGLAQVAMANVANESDSPLVLYKDGTNALKLVRFNTTQVLYEWTPVEAGLYEFDIVCSRTTTLVVYHDGFNNDTYWSVHLHIVAGQPTTGFADLLQVHCNSPMSLESLCYKNSTDTFQMVEWAYYSSSDIVFSADSVSNRSLPCSECAMPKIDLSEGRNTILLGFNYSKPGEVSCMLWVTAPKEAESTTVYYLITAASAPTAFPMYVLYAVTFVSAIVVLSRKSIIRGVREAKSSQLWQSRLTPLRGRAAAYVKNRRPYLVSPLWAIPNVILAIVVFVVVLSSPLGSLFVLAAGGFLSLSPSIQLVAASSTISLVMLALDSEGSMKYLFLVVLALPVAALLLWLLNAIPAAVTLLGVCAILIVASAAIECPMIYLTSRQVAYTRSPALLDRVPYGKNDAARQKPDHQACGNATTTTVITFKRPARQRRATRRAVVAPGRRGDWRGGNVK